MKHIRLRWGQRISNNSTRLLTFGKQREHNISKWESTVQWLHRTRVTCKVLAGGGGGGDPFPRKVWEREEFLEISTRAPPSKSPFGVKRAWAGAGRACRRGVASQNRTKSSDFYFIFGISSDLYSDGCITTDIIVRCFAGKAKRL